MTGFWRGIIKILFTLFLTVACLHPGITEAEQATTSAASEEYNTLAEQDTGKWYDIAHQRVSATLLSSSEWVDDFFDDVRYVDEENRTRARLKLTAIYDEKEEFEFKPRLNIRVHLPNLSEQLSLLLFASEDEKPELDAAREGARVSGENIDREATAALQYFLRETEKYNISFSGGFSFNYLYGGLRYRYLKDIGSWKGRFVTQPRYYTDDGWQDLNTLDFDRTLSENWFLRASVQLDWFEEEETLPLALILRLYQQLGPERFISYEWENHCADVQHDELTDLWLLIRYRQKFLRDWLFLEISPRVNFPREDDWEANYGLLFRIEMNFSRPATTVGG
ncbi:MAG: hypothetical protein C4563_11500 [Desulfobulbus sp.]|nr:MAG: hypothetical protein C4563_11500 [Desulfobulbus sp.]